MYAATLARFGVNIVRLHFLDLPAPRGIIDSTRDDSRSFNRHGKEAQDERRRPGADCGSHKEAVGGLAESAQA